MASHIVSDVKKLNTGKIDNKTNKDLQNFLYKMLEDRNGTAAKCSLDVLVKLYRKKVWEDSKTVNVMASACFSQEAKVRATALNFFLGVDDEQMAKADADSDDELLDDLTIKQVAGTYIHVCVCVCVCVYVHVCMHTYIHTYIHIYIYIYIYI
jgi:hypothetical protein